MRRKEYEIDETRDEKTAKGRKGHFLSYIICALAAIVLWLVIMNVTDSKLPGSANKVPDDTDAAFDLTV